MIGCHIDITARKQAEEALIRARDAANAANQAKSAFLANMSHELRTPLNAVMGFAQVLEFSPRLNETDKQQVNSIYKGGQYLLTLINDILDLAKIEAGRIELYPENIEVHSFFQELAEMLRFRAEKKGVIFSYQLDDTLPDAIVTDAKRLRQVIMNLLGNAVKFTSQGQVVLRVSFQAPNLHIRVADTGPGIAPEHHADIFQPFSQVGDKKQNAEGTGLGLSITHKIVELMRGHIELDSQLGQGSVFRLQIPVETRVILPVEDANPLPLPHHISAYERTDDNSHALRILLVDDVADNRAILRHMLEPLGFELEQCDSGETCLQCAPSFAPDLVLLDLRMPVLDGLATLRKFHELPGMADIPVVMVSASAYEHDQTNARAAGCVDYLSKPVDRAALLQTLQKHLALAWQYSDAISQRQTTYTRLDAQQRAELLRLTQRGEVDAVMAKLAHLCETQNSPSQAHKLLELARSFQLSELQQQLKMPEND
jgi:CheY-like chemotaxis protein